MMNQAFDCLIVVAMRKFVGPFLYSETQPKKIDVKSAKLFSKILSKKSIVIYLLVVLKWPVAFLSH